jgi:hypothetical protein
MWPVSSTARPTPTVSFGWDTHRRPSIAGVATTVFCVAPVSASCGCSGSGEEIRRVELLFQGKIATTPLNQSLNRECALIDGNRGRGPDTLAKLEG